VDFKEIEEYDVVWSNLAQKRSDRQAVVNTVINLPVTSTHL
jgi:hypothetical protein